MTDADEKLARLLKAPIAPMNDGEFLAKTDRSLRRCRTRALAGDILRGVILMVLVWISIAFWRETSPLLEPLVPQINQRLLGAPAPVLAVLGMAGLFWSLLRIVRRSYRRGLIGSP